MTIIPAPPTLLMKHVSLDHAILNHQGVQDSFQDCFHKCPSFHMLNSLTSMINEQYRKHPKSKNQSPDNLSLNDKQLKIN